MSTFSSSIAVALAATACSLPLIPAGQTHHAVSANRTEHRAIHSTIEPANRSRTNATDQNYLTFPESSPDYHGSNGG
jgi:hypothetical protein